jgi:hypothetical protein
VNAVSRYLGELTETVGRNWNRFWFTPQAGPTLGWLRLLSGLLAVYFLLSHTADLERWFGPHGLLPVETVRQLGGEQSGLHPLRFSPLAYLQTPASLWMFHLTAIAAAVAFAAGLASRVTGVLTLAAVLSYVHRAPMIAAQFDVVLAMLLCYLCLGPTGEHLAVDAWWRKRGNPEAPGPSLGQAISLRFIQVHTVGFYVLMGLTMLAGQVWWSGDAIWWLIARPDSRLIDLTFLYRAEYLLNLWTHATVGFALLFGILIWHPPFRPLLLALAVPFWLSLGLVSGQVAVAGAMLVASMSFLPAPVVSRWVAAAQRRRVFSAPI